MLKKSLKFSSVCVLSFVFANSQLSAESVSGASLVSDAVPDELAADVVRCEIPAAEAGDRLWLKDILMGKLYEGGLSENFMMWGDGHLTATMTKQEDYGERKKDVISYRGDIHFQYSHPINGGAVGLKTRARTRSGLIKRGGEIVDMGFVFLQSDRFGEFRAGFSDTVADIMAIDGFAVSVGYDGPACRGLGIFFNKAAGTRVDTCSFVDDCSSAKVTWLSPTFKGASFGASFTFDGRYRHPFKTLEIKDLDEGDNWKFARTPDYSKNIVTLGAKYECGNNDGFNAKVGAVGWFGSVKRGKDGPKVNDVRAYQVGAVFGYKNVKLAAGFTDNGKSFVPIKLDPEGTAVGAPNSLGMTVGADAGKIYTVGVSCDIKKLTISTEYFRSVVNYSKDHKDRATADIYTVAAEYKFNKIFSTYVEYNSMDTKTSDRAIDWAKAGDQSTSGSNKGHVIIIGTKVKF